MKMPIYDKDSGAKLGSMEVPDEIIEAAAKLSAWLEANNPLLQLHGLKLVYD